MGLERPSKRFAPDAPHLNDLYTSSRLLRRRSCSWLSAVGRPAGVRGTTGRCVLLVRSGVSPARRFAYARRLLSLLARLLACSPARLRACVPACLRACVPACLRKNSRIIPRVSDCLSEPSLPEGACRCPTRW